MSRFSENLRRIRFERHMTQEEFATLLGTTKQNISRYESGAVSPKITTAQIIADKLGISLSELNGDDGSIDFDLSDLPSVSQDIIDYFQGDEEKIKQYVEAQKRNMRRVHSAAWYKELHSSGVHYLAKARPEELEKHIDKIAKITVDKEMFGKIKTTTPDLDDDLKQLKAAIHINPELRDLIKMQATASKSEIKQMTAFLKAIREE